MEISLTSRKLLSISQSISDEAAFTHDFPCLSLSTHPRLALAGLLVVGVELECLIVE